jgi:hypothetical protein
LVDVGDLEVGMDESMHGDVAASERSSTGILHPFVYKAMIGFAAWFVLAAWAFYAARGYIVLLLAVVTWLVGVVVAIPLIFARLGRRDNRRTRVKSSLRNWARGDFELLTGRVKASVAILEIFVPIAAVAIGLTLFAIVKDALT